MCQSPSSLLFLNFSSYLPNPVVITPISLMPKQDGLLPGRSCKTSENQSLLVVVHFGDIRRFHPLPDPVTLLQRVNEHELDTDVVTVRLL